MRKGKHPEPDLDPYLWLMDLDPVSACFQVQLPVPTFVNESIFCERYFFGREKYLIAIIRLKIVRNPKNK